MVARVQEPLARKALPHDVAIVQPTASLPKRKKLGVTIVLVLV
jgi:hypothetical protein